MTRLPLLAIMLASCGTYAGKDRVAVYSNCSYVEWHGGDRPSLVMKDVNNSSPTRAGGSVLGTGLSGIMGIMAAAATHGIVK